MNKLYSLLLLACLAHTAMSYLIAPTILNPHSSVNKTICQDDQLEGAFKGEPESLVGPYLFCLHEARLQIHKATLVTSDVDSCPLQYVTDNFNSFCPIGTQPNDVDVTVTVKTRCEAKEQCFFSFDTLFPNIACRTKPFPKKVPRDFQKLHVSYSCELIRPKFRPFANKKYNPKFSRNIAHPYRKLSYNHLQAL